MRCDEELFDYFYRHENIDKLEELITGLSYPDILPKTIQINSLDEAKFLYDRVYPKVENLFSEFEFERPELKLYDDSLFQESRNDVLVREVKKNALIFSAIGAYVLRPLLVSGIVVGSIFGTAAAVPITLAGHKAAHILSEGISDTFENIIYAKKGNLYQDTMHNIAHELTHRINVQINPRTYRQNHLREGLAEAVAFQIDRDFSDKVGPNVNEEIALKLAYMDLCRAAKIKNKLFAEKELLKDFNPFKRSYFVGYAAIRLYQLEKGDEVFSEILRP